MPGVRIQTLVLSGFLAFSELSSANPVQGTKKDPVNEVHIESCVCGPFDATRNLPDKASQTFKYGKLESVLFNTDLGIQEEKMWRKYVAKQEYWAIGKATAAEVAPECLNYYYGLINAGRSAEPVRKSSSNEAPVEDTVVEEASAEETTAEETPADSTSPEIPVEWQPAYKIDDPVRGWQEANPTDNEASTVALFTAEYHGMEELNARFPQFHGRAALKMTWNTKAMFYNAMIEERELRTSAVGKKPCTKGFVCSATLKLNRLNVDIGYFLYLGKRPEISQRKSTEKERTSREAPIKKGISRQSTLKVPRTSSESATLTRESKNAALKDREPNEGEADERKSEPRESNGRESKPRDRDPKPRKLKDRKSKHKVKNQRQRVGTHGVKPQRVETQELKTW